MGEATTLVTIKFSPSALLNRLTDTVLNSTLLTGLALVSSMFGRIPPLQRSPLPNRLLRGQAPSQNEQPLFAVNIDLLFKHRVNMNYIIKN